MIYNIIWRLIAVLHGFFIVINVLSMIILPFTQTIWVWIPMESFLINLMFNRAFAACPITAAENYFRLKAGYKPIKSYVGHYILLPLRRMKRKYQ